MNARPVEELIREKQIGQITNKKLVQAPPSTTIRQAVALMQEQRSGYIVIAEQGDVTGVFTETDVARKVLGQSVDWNQPVSTVMTPNPLTLQPSSTLSEAIKLMGDHRIYHLPLVDENNKLVNVLSVRSVIRFFAEYYPDEVLNLPPDPSQVIDTPEGG